MFSCSNGGRLCVCGHIKSDHDEGGWCLSCDVRDPPSPYCQNFQDRAPETAPKEVKISADQNERGIVAKRIWV